jgi:hypothetical protein
MMSARAAVARLPDGGRLRTSVSGQRHVIRGTGTNAIGNASQGFAAYNDNDDAYISRRVDTDTASIISRFRRTGVNAQVATDASTLSSALGHQQLAVEPGTGKLWTSTSASQSATRFDYVAGSAIANAQDFRLFGNDVTASGNTNPAISEDGVWLVARGRLSDTSSKYRVFRLATLIAGGAGDYSTGYHVWEWTVSDFSATDYPEQGMCCFRGVLYIVAGDTDPAKGKKLRAYTLAGRKLYPDRADLTLGLAYSTPDAGGGTALYEPEGLAIVKEDGRYWLDVLMCTGPNAQRVNRVIRIGQTYRDLTPSQMVDKIVAAASVAPSTPRKALYEALYTALDASDLRSKLGTLYILAAATSDVALLNLIDPGYLSLTATGTLTFTADRGYASDGTTGYLSHGQSWFRMPQMLRDVAHVGAWCNTSAATGGGLVGTLTGTYTFLYPRNGSNQFQSRLNHGSAVDTGGITVTDASGHWILDRATNAEYSAYRDGTKLFDASVAAVSLAGNMTILRSPSTFTNSSTQVSIVHNGYTMSDADRTALRAAFATYLTAVGAL